MTAQEQTDRNVAADSEWSYLTQQMEYLLPRIDKGLTLYVEGLAFHGTSAQQASFYMMVDRGGGTAEFLPYEGEELIYNGTI